MNRGLLKRGKEALERSITTRRNLSKELERRCLRRMKRLNVSKTSSERLNPDTKATISR